MPQPRYRLVILAVAFTTLFFSGGSRHVFGLLLKPMAESLDWSRTSLSVAVALFMLVSAMLMPFVGRLADRHSLRHIMGAGIVVAAVGLGLVSFVEARWQLFVAYGIVHAAGISALGPTVVGVLVSRWFPERRGLANSAALAGNAVGQLTIITLFSSVLLELDWRQTFGFLGIAWMVGLAPLVLATVRSRPGPGGRDRLTPGQRTVAPLDSPGAGPAGETAAGRQMWLLLVIYACCGFQDFFVATHVVAFATDQGVGTALAGNLLALMGFMGLLGVLLAGVVADARGATLPTAICFALRIVLFAGILYFQSTAAIAAFALLYGFTFLVTAPLVVVYVSNIFGSARLGVLTGTVSMVHQIAGGVGALTGAAIYDRFDTYNPAFSLMLLVAVAALAVTLTVRERRAEPKGSAEGRAPLP